MTDTIPLRPEASGLDKITRATGRVAARPRPFDGRTTKRRSAPCSSERPSEESRMETVEIAIERRTGGGKGAARQAARHRSRARRALRSEARGHEHQRRRRRVRAQLGHLEGSHLIRLRQHGRTTRSCTSAWSCCARCSAIRSPDALLHADFYEVDLTERLVVSVPLHFIGQGGRCGRRRHPPARHARARGRVPADRDPGVHRGRRHAARHPRGHPPRGRAASRGRARSSARPTQTVVTVLPPTVETKPAEAAEVTPEAEAAEGQAPAAEGAGKKTPDKGGEG